MRIFNNRRGILFLLASLSAVASFAGPYPGSLRDHGHSGSGDGGTIANLSLTTSVTVPQLKNTSLIDTVPVSSQTVITSTGGTRVGLNIDGVKISTGEVSSVLSINGGAVGMFRNKLANGDFYLDHQNSYGAVSVSMANYSNTTSTSVADGWLMTLSTGSSGAQPFLTTLVYSISTQAIPGASYALYFDNDAVGGMNSDGRAEFSQAIPGSATREFAFGTTQASTVTLSFYVNANVTGTFGGSLCNQALNRCYVFPYQINAISTWEKKTIVVPGDTSGTWSTVDSSTGIVVRMDLGSGTALQASSSTWNSSNAIKSVNFQRFCELATDKRINFADFQLEKGSVATAFEYRAARIESLLLQSNMIGVTGEVISSNTSSGHVSAVATSGNFGNVAQILVTPGTWDITGFLTTTANGATITTQQATISTFSGNTTTDHSLGVNHVQGAGPVNGATGSGSVIPEYRQTVTTTTRYYLKAALTYSVATPNVTGFKLSARRVGP